MKLSFAQIFFKKSELRLVLGLLMGFFTIDATYAGSVDQATITSVSPIALTNVKGQDGAFVMSASPAPGGQPSCSTSHRFAANPATDSGRMLISSILAAQAEARPVFIQGNGTCDIWSDSESIMYMTTE